MKEQESLDQLKSEIINDAMSYNRHFTKEFLRTKSIEYCIGNAHPTYRDGYKERLRKITRKQEVAQ